MPGALLRRVRKLARAPQLLRLGEVQIDFARQQAWRNKTPLHLTAKEFAMLRLMMETPGEPVSRERFLDAVWGYTAFPTTRTVDTHIASLRAALEPDPESPALDSDRPRHRLPPGTSCQMNKNQKRGQS